MSIRLRDCICALETDIDEGDRFDAREMDASVNRSVDAVTDSLQQPSTALSPVVRQHLTQIFLMMRHGHRAIRELLRSDGKDSMAVSAMPLARVQVETLFAVCLIVERQDSLWSYLKDGWRKNYVRHLLMREEWGRLPRIAEAMQKMEADLDAMRLAAGVTDAERITVDFEELGKPLPVGMKLQHIKAFPTPERVIAQIEQPSRKKMLRRFYPEYRFLCGFVHFSPAASILSALFDQRQRYQTYFSASQLEEIFQKEIAGPALWLDQISVLQGCSEIYGIYPHDIELARAVSEGWTLMSKACLVGQAVWKIRASELLGAVRTI